MVGKAIQERDEVRVAEYPADEADGIDGAQEVQYERTVVGSKGRPEVRKVVHTLAECFAGLGDYYHPERGWFRSGGKAEKDPPEVVGGLSPEDL